MMFGWGPTGTSIIKGVPVGPQPNIANLHAHIVGLAEEVALLGNVPALPAILHLMQQQQLDERFAEVGSQLNELIDSVNHIRARFEHRSFSLCLLMSPQR
jgi:hypothetical protein